MVWSVQNCRSNKCMQFLKPPELRRGGSPPGAPTRALSWTRWGTLTQTPLLLTPPLITNPGSAPDVGPEIWMPFLSLEGNVLLVALVIARIIY